MTKTEERKAATRQRIINTAFIAFRSSDYHSVTMRDLAVASGFSTGAIFSNFATKADLFETVMGFKPPLDGPVTRAAPLLLNALIAAQDGLARNSQAWLDAQTAINLAQSPLDGEVWEKHLDQVSGIVTDDAAPAVTSEVVLRNLTAGA